MKKKELKAIREQQQRREQRVRTKVFGTADRPRLAVRRTSKYFSAQVIDDTVGNTLVSVHSRELKKSDAKKAPVERASALGTLLAEKAKKAGIEKVVFDRRMYLYHGRVKAFADGARENGLQF